MRAVEGEENSSDTFNSFYRCTGLRLKALGVAWARLDHAGKDPTKGQRGSSAKDGDVDLVLRLDRVEGGVTVKATHRRINWYPELTTLKVTGEHGERHIGLDGGDHRLYLAGTKEAAEQLDGLGLPADAGRRKYRQALKEQGVKMSDRLLSDALAWRRQGGAESARATPLEAVLEEAAHRRANHSRHLEEPQVDDSRHQTRHSRHPEASNCAPGSVTSYAPGTRTEPEPPGSELEEDPF
jgi:hypothetical protein